jgi:mono/diheme cytochrome c family protein
MGTTPLISLRKSIAALIVVAAATGCKPSIPPSTPLSQLTPQQLSGHEIFASRCAGCHYANSENPLHGPGLQGLYKKKYLPSGAPANDGRVTAVILRGRSMMPAFGNNIGDQQLADLLAYLHTL